MVAQPQIVPDPEIISLDPPVAKPSEVGVAETAGPRPCEKGEAPSLFQSLETSPPASEEDSESDADLDLSKVNSDWASLKVELESLTAQAGVPKGNKGRKGKHSAQMETPEMFKLRTKMSKMEKDYMFNRKDAGKSVRPMQRSTMEY